MAENNISPTVVNPQSPEGEKETNTGNSQQDGRTRPVYGFDAQLSQNFTEIESLRQNGFCVLPKVFSEQHCHEEIEKIWDFYEDVSNCNVKRMDPSSWGKNGICSPQWYFDGFGAGWVLGETREILSNKVFESLYGTTELLCSKEGFRLVAETSENPSIMQVPSCYKNSDNLEISIRAIAVLNGGIIPDSGSSCVRMNLLRNYSSLSENQQQTQTQQIIELSTGDVLLFCSDIQVEEEYSKAHSDFSWKDAPSVMYCSMQPALDLNNSKRLWNLKIEAYKQRQTGTYDVMKEDWSPPSHACGRSYFRTGPPIVSRRLAELYGLLPYHSENWENEINRAIIRGVRFVDDSYEVLPPSIRPKCQAKSTQLVSSDPNLLTGQDKYLGGMASPCGRYIYGVPGTARRVLRISTETGVMDCIGPSFDGKFKWLRGVEVPPSVMSLAEYPDGCCIALSCNHLSFLKVNPATNKVYTFGNELLEKECAGVDGWYYHGGNLASNGWIYCIPANANRVAKLNPCTDEVCFLGPTFEGRQKWFGGIIGSDGCIYGIPHNAQGVLRIDPSNDNIDVLEGTTGPLPPGKWKWHGGLAAGDKIIGFPNNSDEVLVVNCQESTVYTIGSANILISGRHRIPQDGRYKYLGGALTRDGRYAYLFPCDAERVLRIDCQTEELALVGPCLMDGENKFQNGFCAKDGCLYGIPQRAVGVVRVVPNGGDGSSDVVDIIPCGEDMMGVKDKFEGGVLGLDGCMYCIPLRARSCVKITPEVV